MRSSGVKGESAQRSKRGEYTALSDSRCHREPVRKSTGCSDCTLGVRVNGSDVIQKLHLDVILLQYGQYQMKTRS